MIRYRATAAAPIVLLLGALFADPATAQVRTPERFGNGSSIGPSLLPGGTAAEQAGNGPSPGLAVLASAVLPGAGQFMQGEDRWIPYVVVEAWAWVTHFALRRRASEFTREYRDLAWSVARRVSTGERRDTIFEYYETLGHWETSGAWDVDPRTDGVQPELDRTTFNGDVWRLARALYIPGGANAPVGSPEYQRALDYYLRHAIPAGYAWAWGPSSLEQQRFRELIRESDEAARGATLRLGIVLANHVVSAVDALVLERIRETAPDGPQLRLHSGLENAADGARWSAFLRLEW